MIDERRKTITSNKQGAIDDSFIAAGAIILVLLIAAPMILKMVITPLDKFSNAVGGMNLTGAKSGTDMGNQSGQHIETVFSNFFDKLIVVAVIGILIILVISAAVIPAHPMFFILYVLLGIMGMIFLPELIVIADHFYQPSTNQGANFTAEVALLPFSSYLVDHFGTILLAFFIIGAIVMWGKIMYGGGRGKVGN